jgi:hypothetical protein
MPRKVDETAWESGILRTSERLKISPLEFERTVEIQDNEVQLSCCLSKLGAKEEHYLWAMHQLLRLRQRDHLRCLPLRPAGSGSEGWHL